MSLEDLVVICMSSTQSYLVANEPMNFADLAMIGMSSTLRTECNSLLCSSTAILK